MLRIARSQEAVDRQLKQYDTDQVNNQLTDQVNAVGDKSDGNTRSGKGKKFFSCDQEGHFSQWRLGSVQCLTELADCAVLMAISELNVPELVSMVVVLAPDLEGVKVAKALKMEEEILGVDEVTVEEDVVVVVEGGKKQTLGLTGITAKNLPDWFIVQSLHFLWNS